MYNGRQVGPNSIANLISLYKARTVDMNTYFWREGLDNSGRAPSVKKRSRDEEYGENDVDDEEGYGEDGYGNEVEI